MPNADIQSALNSMDIWPSLPLDAWRDTYEAGAKLAHWDRAALERTTAA